MELNTKKLIEALIELRDNYGLTYTQITEDSDVNNIGRIVTGETTPTTQSWFKLHEAYPHIVPHPSYIDNSGQVYKAETNMVMTGNNGTQFTAHQGNRLTAGQEYLINIINRAADPDGLVDELIDIAKQSLIGKKQM